MKDIDFTTLMTQELTPRQWVQVGIDYETKRSAEINADITRAAIAVCVLGEPLALNSLSMAINRLRETIERHKR